jgi:hypothetical protein
MKASSMTTAVEISYPQARWFLSRRIGLAAWILFAVAVSVNVCIAPYSHTNYPCYESGSRLWWAERNMYDTEQCPLDFRYGPLFAVALTPLTCLPTWLGGLFWNWLNIGLFLWAARAWARRILPCAWNDEREAVFLLLMLVASGRMLWSAQANSLIFAAVAGASLAILDRRWWLAVILLAAPVHIKVWPLAAAGLLIACWPRQLGWRFAVSLLVLAALPLATKPPAIVWARYCDWFAAITGPMLHVRHEYRDAWTLWEFIQWPIDPIAYMVMQVSTGMLALALCLRQQEREPNSPARLLTFVMGMWTAWQLVFGPGTERNTFGLIGPLAAWAVVAALADHRGRIWMVAAFTLMTILARGQIERALLYKHPLIITAHPIGVMMLACWLVYYFWRKQDSQPGRLLFQQP